MRRIIHATVRKPRPARIAPPLAAHKPAPGATAQHALAASIYADLLGTPFQAGGRGPHGYDCVGLALEIAKRLGKTLPAFVSSEAELHAQLGAGNATLADLPQVSRPAPGCIVLMRMAAGEHHVGVMVDEYRMIHAFNGVGAAIERVNAPLWQRKVIGFYSL